MQMNPCLKELLRDKDFEESAPMLFGENFGSLAKERLEAAAETLSMDKHSRGCRVTSCPKGR